MTDTPLTCNLLSCRKKLGLEACVTSCSHIFCSQHTSALKDKKKPVCLACGTQLNNELDVVCVDLNPNEQYKTMILTGLTPDQIMEIATRAIGFYVYQLNYNCLNKEALLRGTKEQMDDLKQYCTALTSKFKTDLLKEQRKAANIKQELEDKIKEIEAQQQQLAQWKRANKKLQMQVESQKREIVNLKISPINKTPEQLQKPMFSNNNFGNYFSNPFESNSINNTEAPPSFPLFGRFSH
ncbi:hypothetical protein RN001_009667 [Aquatica leii]|uniref:RING-type domain-containing protein n=1 Tax=Aquatica leii TaxID=1421715 RepID=A0AAN7P921_9COLE|nr:hypothetical protein RN001_009667 [Aquatica leii]